MLRGLAVALILALAVWSGWWWWTASQAESQINTWFEDRRAAGWEAELAELSIAGYPNRLDATLTAPQLADPDAGWAWRTDAARILRIAYTPEKAIIILPETQSFATPMGWADLEGERMRASADFASGQAMEVEQIIAEATALRATGGGRDRAGGWSATAARGVAAIKRADAARGLANAYDVSLTAKDLGLDDATRGRLDPAGLLPDVMEQAEVDATVALDRVLDRASLEDEAPLITAISLRKAVFQWGALELRAKGQLKVAPDGAPEGDLELSARNWEQMLDAAIGAGMLDSATGEAARTGLRVLSLLSDDKDAIEAPLRFSDGRVYVGPVPMGDAPRLTFRNR